MAGFVANQNANIRGQVNSRDDLQNIHYHFESRLFRLPPVVLVLGRYPDFGPKLPRHWSGRHIVGTAQRGRSDVTECRRLIDKKHCKQASAAVAAAVELVTSHLSQDFLLVALNVPNTCETGWTLQVPLWSCS